MYMGGSTVAAARRAARCNMGLYAQSGDAELEEAYRTECERLGHTPKDCIVPPPGLVTSAFIAEDPDRAWRDMGEFLLHDARMYAQWLGDARSAVKNTATTVAELRSDPGSYRIFTPAEAVDYIRRNGVLVMQPLCGGMPPELAWQSLNLLATEVLPARA
jgi:alkanesulfonate monooxygenase SsuD/methylene tetrahydromethanopterin reductase-like flavin-dependent oxidoreductase (luciferase family)